MARFLLSHCTRRLSSAPGREGRGRLRAGPVTGEQRYGRKRIDPAASGFTASPWAYNGKIFAASEDGDTFVIEAGPEYKLVGKNSLGEMIIATAAIVRNSLIVRTVGRVYRIADVSKPSRK